MKLRRFEARKIHGYLDFEVTFNPTITFLTGINGSGKTTVVNSVSALISPSFAFLCEIRYLVMRVVIETDGQLVEITASRDDNAMTLRHSLEEEALTVPVLSEEVIANFRHDREVDFYREQEARASAHPVMRRLKTLPTPMFLGLDRRSASLFSAEVHGPANQAWRRRTHNVFSTSLTRSLSEAAALAERSHNQVQAQLRDLTDLLKQQFILSALQYAPLGHDRAAKLPTVEPGEVARVKASLKEIGLTEEQIEKHLNPFIEKFKQMAKYAPFDERLDGVMSGDDQEKKSAYIEWLTHRGQFDRLSRLLRQVDRYLKSSQKLNAPLDGYLATVNNFLRDSGKSMQFDRAGSLTVTLGDGSNRPINALSSGESQIVVMLTHLAFNPAARYENLFIVDEPELSLHLRWQELFVNAIRTLNSALQVILATHSPAIILEDLEHCVDLSQPLPQ